MWLHKWLLWSSTRPGAWQLQPQHSLLSIYCHSSVLCLSKTSLSSLSGFFSPTSNICCLPVLLIAHYLFEISMQRLSVFNYEFSGEKCVCFAQRQLVRRVLKLPMRSQLWQSPATSSSPLSSYKKAHFIQMCEVMPISRHYLALVIKLINSALF